MSSTSSRKLPRRCWPPPPQPARNSATAFPSSRAADPGKAERAQSRKATRQQQQVSKLFEHRYLFVQHRLTADQKTTLQRITGGSAKFRRLRQIMEEVHRIAGSPLPDGDGAGSTGSATGTREPVQAAGPGSGTSFPARTWRKALMFPDDKLLPATSNAVERSLRYRKAQKSIYSVRTAEHIRQRIALDMQRDQQAPDRAQTTKALHQARSGTKKLQE